jgi:hypothetical protein
VADKPSEQAVRVSTCAILRKEYLAAVNLKVGWP